MITSTEGSSRQPLSFPQSTKKFINQFLSVHPCPFSHPRLPVILSTTWHQNEIQSPSRDMRDLQELAWVRVSTHFLPFSPPPPPPSHGRPLLPWNTRHTCLCVRVFDLVFLLTGMLFWEVIYIKYFSGFLFWFPHLCCYSGFTYSAFLSS